MLDPRASRRAFTGPGFEDGQVRADLDRIEREQVHSERERSAADDWFEAKWSGAVPTAIRFDTHLPARSTLSEQVRQYVEWSSRGNTPSIPLTTWRDYPCPRDSHDLIFGLDSRTRNNPAPWHMAVVSVHVAAGQSRSWRGTAFWIHDSRFYGNITGPPTRDFDKPSLTPPGPGASQEESRAHYEAVTQWMNDEANYMAEYEAWVENVWGAAPPPGSPVILLTAAHNLWDPDTDTLVDPSHVAICRAGDRNSCRNWVSPPASPSVVTVNWAYRTGFRDSGMDWGILGLADPDDRLKAAMGWKPFRLATATDSSIRAGQAESGFMKTGFPGFVNGCTENIHKYTERNIHLRSIGQRALHLKADVSSGESGSPVYSCGNLDPAITIGGAECSEGDTERTAYAVAVVAQTPIVQGASPIPDLGDTHPEYSEWTSSSRTVSGPKIPFHYAGIVAEARVAVALIVRHSP